MIVALALLLIEAPVRAADDPGSDLRWFGQVEMQASILGDLGDRRWTGTSFGPALKAGYRWKDWGVFISVEHNMWVLDDSTQNPTSSVEPGALNIGIGAEYIYAYRWLRLSLALGPSILLYDTFLDSAGTTGLYFDFRPTGVRWPIKDWFVVLFDPVSFALVGPVLTGIPLALVQYRTTVTTEFRW